MGKGMALILCSSLLSCFGQLCWKLSSGANGILFLTIGFVLYGCGALLMVLALRYGELSVLHPMLSFGYILSMFLGAFALHEYVTIQKVLGVCLIITGLTFLSTAGRDEV